MKRGLYLVVGVSVVLGMVIVTTGGAQVYPVLWYEDQPELRGVTPPSLVLADGDLQFPDGTVQVTAAGSGESLGVTPSPSLVLAEGGLQFSDGTVQTTAAGSLVPQTGQKICYDAGGLVIDCATDIGPGQDGDLQIGAPWPNPRFTKNGDGTVTDNLTGLIWLENANCFGTQNWTNALAESNALYDGCSDCGGTENDCGLSDGSVAGQWHLPNMGELFSLVHWGVSDPAVPNTAGTGKWVEGDPFSNVQDGSIYGFWSSTTRFDAQANAWIVQIESTGEDTDSSKTSSYGVWPVRGGQ